MTFARLPLLEPHRATLEKCVYCPKLSRAACPVSNVEASETTTPWGKMSLAYFAARADVPHDEEHAASAWACTGCYACRERCDHKNEVATVLLDARAEHLSAGVAPAAAKARVEGFAAWSASAAHATREALHGSPHVAAPSSALESRAFVGGCGYAMRAPEVLRDAAAATRALTGSPVRPAAGCCGLPLLHAGDRDGFAKHAARFVDELGDGAVVLDPGCARALTVELARTTGRAAKISLFVDVAHAKLAKLRPGARPGPVRWHDPCQLGRGLGRFDEPRAILARVTGEPAREFLRARDHAECSGGGGMLPAARPESSRAIADVRLEEHRERAREDHATLVTGCASSLVRFRTRGEPAEDLATYVARALED